MSERTRGLIGKAKAAVQADLQRSSEATAAQREQAIALTTQRAEQAEEIRKLNGRWEYRVEQLRETLVGDKIKTDALQQTLNARAAEGWRVKSITAANVAGRVGPGGTGGLLVVFERQLPA